MIRSAPTCLAETTRSSPTAPSPTTASVEPGFTLAALAANHPGAYDAEERQQARNHPFRENIQGNDQVAVGEWDAQLRRLGSADELGVLAGRLVSDLTAGTSVVKREEQADDELAGLDGADSVADLLDDATLLGPIGVGLATG
jgi:hypothetical protein